MDRPHRRALPTRYGPWATVATRVYRWTKSGLWERILHTLQAQADARGERKRGERLINRLKQFRRIATRSEKRAVNYAVNYKAMLTLAAILLWLSSENRP